MSNKSPVYNEEKFVTWDEVQEYCRSLAQRILDTGRTFDKILAITRGGMFPAGILARELEIRRVENICIDTYDAQNIKTPTLLKPAAPEYLTNVLVVDDLSDKGVTLKMVRSMTTNPLVLP